MVSMSLVYFTVAVALPPWPNDPPVVALIPWSYMAFTSPPGHASIRASPGWLASALTMAVFGPRCTKSSFLVLAKMSPVSDTLLKVPVVVPAVLPDAMVPSWA